LTGIGSVFVGSIAAIYQKRLKRLLAFSGISHVGFIILGIACASFDSTQSCMLYSVLYSIMGIVTFCVVLSVTSSELFLKYLTS